MTAIEEYFAARDAQVAKNAADETIAPAVHAFMDTVHRTNYVKNFTWAGIPIMQLPTDLMAMQEIIWQVRPDYIIETGVAFGGMLIFYASILSALGKGRVIGVDIDVREHTRQTLKQHPLKDIITVHKRDSLDTHSYFAFLRNKRLRKKVLVSLDSNHTHAHVLQELRLYAPLVSLGSYIVVFDTSIEWLDPKYIGNRPWGPGNSPWSAVQEFMRGNDEFIVDQSIEDRILLTSAPGGWLKRIK